MTNGKLDALNEYAASGKDFRVSLDFIRDIFEPTFTYKVGFTVTWQEKFQKWAQENRLNCSKLQPDNTFFLSKNIIVD